MTTPLTVTSAHRRFGDVRALAGCSFSLRPGGVTAIVGPNGSGKTTLMEAIVGLQLLDSGQIHVNGAPAPAERMHPALGYLAQDRPLYRNLTVGDHLRFGRNMNPRWDASYATRLITDVGISAKQRVARLSGGQRTRLALALTLGRRPSILILDEPLADLDPVAKLDVQGVLMADVAEHGTSILLSSHVLAEVADVAEDILIMHSGQIRAAGEVEGLVSSHTFLTGPATTAADLTFLPVDHIIWATHTTRQTTLLVHGVPAVPEGWTPSTPTLEEVIVAYLRSGRTSPSLPYHREGETR